MKKLLFLAALLVIGAASAQTYPARPIKIIVPFTPGSATDVMGRIVSERLNAAWGQPVVVDNRPGAGGTIGFEMVVRANPDGYTLVMVNSNYSATSAIQKLSYDPVKDIEPIVLIGETGLVLTVHPSMPVSVKEFVAHARTNPGKLSFSRSSGATWKNGKEWSRR